MYFRRNSNPTESGRNKDIIRAEGEMPPPYPVLEPLKVLLGQFAVAPPAARDVFAVKIKRLYFPSDFSFATSRRTRFKTGSAETRFSALFTMYSALDVIRNKYPALTDDISKYGKAIQHVYNLTRGFTKEISRLRLGAVLAYFTEHINLPPKVTPRIAFNAAYYQASFVLLKRGEGGRPYIEIDGDSCPFATVDPLIRDYQTSPPRLTPAATFVLQYLRTVPPEAGLKQLVDIIGMVFTAVAVSTTKIPDTNTYRYYSPFEPKGAEDEDFSIEGVSEGSGSGMMDHLRSRLSGGRMATPEPVRVPTARELRPCTEEEKGQVRLDPAGVPEVVEADGVSPDGRKLTRPRYLEGTAAEKLAAMRGGVNTGRIYRFPCTKGTVESGPTIDMLIDMAEGYVLDEFGY